MKKLAILKSKFILPLTLVIVLIFISLGAYVLLSESKTPPELYANKENTDKIQFIKGGFKWNYLGQHVITDAMHPTQMDFTKKDTISVNPNETLVLTNSRNYRMYIDDINYYDQNLKEIDVEEKLLPSVTEQNVVSVIAPSKIGTYILSVDVNYYQRGSVQYAIKVEVKYDASNLEQYVGTYVGDHIKVSQILNKLPFSKYRNGIELITSKQPYEIIVDYTSADIDMSDLEFNTLALFTLVQNVDIVTYKVKNQDKIDTYTITRNEMKDNDLTISGLKNYSEGK